MMNKEAIQRMLVLFAEDTQSLFESCTRADGTFPDAEDQEYYDMRIAVQEAVQMELSD